MKEILKTIILLSSILVASHVWAIDFVDLKITKKNNDIEIKRVVLEKINDTTSRLVIKKSDITDDVQLIDIFADNAKSKKGDEGFWIMQRGELGYFNRENMSYSAGRRYVYLPYYAMKTPTETFIGVIEGMRFEFNVNVESKNGKYVMYPRWYIGDIGAKPYEDIVITYYKLSNNADYNDMAKAYRKHKFERETDIQPLKKRFAKQPYLEQMAKSIPVRMYFGWKKFNPAVDSRHFYPKGGKPFEVKDYGLSQPPNVPFELGFKVDKEENKTGGVKFSEGSRLLQKAKDMGIDDIAVCVAGWQTGGYDSRCPTSFPVCEEVGGEVELRKFIKKGQSLGYIIDAHHNYTDTFTCSPEWSTDIVCKAPDTKTLTRVSHCCGGIAFNLCLVNARDKFIFRDLPKIADLGFRGAPYIDVFTAERPDRCVDPNHPSNRKNMGEIQKQIALKCHELFGGFASECGFDHIIGQVDYINYVCAPMREKYVYKNKAYEIVDDFVPFWELVYHDIVLHNTDKITQETLSQENNLKLVEFGGRPIFYTVTDKNLPDIKKAYEQFKSLRHLMLEEMISHKKLNDGIYAIKYGNGETIIVNYKDTPYLFKGETVAPKNFKLIKQSLSERFVSFFKTLCK